MIYLALFSIGGLSGFCAGLFGVGGGLIIVPALLLGLPWVGVDGPDVMKIAIATSMAIIVPTGFVSTQAHAAKGAIDMKALSRIAPGAVIGAVSGAQLAAFVDARLITTLFVAFLLFSAARCGLGAKGAGDRRRPLPGALNLSVKGLGIGGLSSLLGIGGATISTPLLSEHVEMRRAIGTSSALGLLLSVGAALGYSAASRPPGCPDACLGYVFLPAVGMIGLGAVLTAPHGARLTHALPTATLRRAFAVLLVVVAIDLACKTPPF